MIDQEFFNSLPADPLEQLSEISGRILRELRGMGAKDEHGPWKSSLSPEIASLTALLFEARARVEGVDAAGNLRRPQGVAHADGVALFRAAVAANNWSKSSLLARSAIEEFDSAVTAYRSILRGGNTEAIEIARNDVQNAINDLRDKISLSELSSEHRARVLDKLNALQAEVDKVTSNWNTALGKMAQLRYELSKYSTLVITTAEPLARVVEGVADLFMLANGLPPRSWRTLAAPASEGSRAMLAAGQDSLGSVDGDPPPSATAK